MKMYNLTITEDQARALKKACEFLARIKIGQVAEVVNHLPLTAENINNRFEVANGLEFLLKPMCGLGKNSSYGVGVFEDADILFDLYEVIRYRLAWDKAVADGLAPAPDVRDWMTMITVDYDKPMHWSKTQPLAKIVSE